MTPDDWVVRPEHFVLADDGAYSDALRPLSLPRYGGQTSPAEHR